MSSLHEVIVWEGGGWEDRSCLRAEGSAAHTEVSDQPQALGQGAAEGILASSTCTDTLSVPNMIQSIQKLLK